MLTITVIVSGEQEKEWNFSVEKDEKILEMFDDYFSYYYNKGAWHICSIRKID